MHIYVFCLDHRSVGTSEIDTFISEGAYFEPGAQIGTLHPTMASDGGDWYEKSIFYQERKRPVVLRCERRRGELAREAAEAIDAFQGAAPGPVTMY